MIPETGFYYLQSRYYDPENHRFINADSYLSTGRGTVAQNMYAYADNSPVMNTDSCGNYTFYTVNEVSDVASLGEEKRRSNVFCNSEVYLRSDRISICR